MIQDNANPHCTPLNDFEENCERTLAKLRIYPGEITAEEVTQALGMSPTSFITKGEKIGTKVPGQFRIGKMNAWFLSSEMFVKSMDLRRHLDWLLDRVEAGAEGLSLLQQKPGVRMCISCIWWSRHGGGGPTLWPVQMRRLAALNLECSFDFQYYGEGSGADAKIQE